MMLRVNRKSVTVQTNKSVKYAPCARADYSEDEEVRSITGISSKHHHLTGTSDVTRTTSPLQPLLCDVLKAPSGRIITRVTGLSGTTAVQKEDVPKEKVQFCNNAENNADLRKLDVLCTPSSSKWTIPPIPPLPVSPADVDLRRVISTKGLKSAIRYSYYL